MAEPLSTTMISLKAQQRSLFTCTTMLCVFLGVHLNSLTPTVQHTKQILDIRIVKGSCKSDIKPKHWANIGHTGFIHTIPSVCFGNFPHHSYNVSMKMRRQKQKQRHVYSAEGNRQTFGDRTSITHTRAAAQYALGSTKTAPVLCVMW